MKWIPSLLLIFSLSSQVWSLSLSDLITRTRLYLRDTSTLPGRQQFTDPQITSFLNDGQAEINARTWSVVNSTSISLSAGTTEYSLPSDYVSPLRVTVNNSPVHERTLSFLDDSGTNWVNDSGTVREFYVRVDSPNFTSAGREVIGLHPVSTATALLVMQYVAQPVSLSNSGDVPFNGSVRMAPFHAVLAYYAAYRGFTILRMFQDALVYFNEYQSLAAVAESDDRSRVLFNPNFRGNNVFQTQK